ncbi:unnamed protein product [Macrosiphum euphorbiae]|nr:unnamed protein product [Macrosiphum euphorbiae]
MNAESLDFMKSKGVAFNYEDCTKKLKQDRGESTPIKSIPQTKGETNNYMNSDLDTRAITTRLDELIKNQKSRNKNQHIRTQRKSVSSRNKWCKKGK